DDEAYDIWTKKVGIAPDHMVRLGKEDNFWEHGSGPCGPCSEIYFDRGPEYGCGKPTCGVGCDCDRYMEIWNLVFSQFDADGKGHYERLARPNIDTGMGLERLACVMQGVGNLFEVDTVQSVLHHVEHIANKTYGENAKDDISIRVITDHIRSCTFMVSDGILPSNEGRGYVLRRLLRRAARHGRMLGITHPFLVELVETVIQSSETAYPELREHDAYIKKVIGTEEANFARTIDAGMNILNNMIDGLEKAHEHLLKGLDVFKLNDTFGFPLDLTKEIAAEQGIEIDEEGFHAEMTKQKERARAERLKKNISGWSEDLFGALDAEPTVFTGYETLNDTGVVVALSDEETLTDAIATDEEAKDGVLVVLDKTPFYAEMGGQAADHGVLNSADCSLRVLDVKKTPKGYYVHTCVLESGIVKVGDHLNAQVDKEYRMAIARNHTATHLLQAALREVLGDHVHQAGSYQDAEITHFDFTHFSAVTPEELARVQKIVNDKIYESMNVTVREMPIEEAKKLGAMALFGEKYGKVVRVVDIEGWSTEFCGGTHVKNTAQIGGFKIVSEASVAAGIRRIEAVTGRNLLIRANLQEAMLHTVANTLKANNVTALPIRAEAVMAENKALTKELEEIKAQVAASKVTSLFDNAEEIGGVKIASAYFTGTTGDTLRGMCDTIRDKAVKPAVAVLVGKAEDKITMAVTVSKQAQEKGLKAGALVKEISAIAGGKAYETMSGTSMAAPQVAGMAALVAQYMKESNVKADGLTTRALIQSLLMSTAVPMYQDYGEGKYGYYSVMQQGAGLANVGAAVSAGTYIMMDKNANAGAADGKVKVELGDDPARTGEYNFGFTIYNLKGAATSFNLSADFFTQNVFANQFEDGSVVNFEDTWTVDGQVVEMAAPEGLANCDFNGDGK
ncbi:MAG: alanine--tRNA ligase, partial [Faecalibacterium sp.]|nr:alanine--tRNA ligase [Faecalibacterium sp.]